MYRSLRTTVSIMVLILASATPAQAVTPSALRAELEGISIPLSEVAAYHCHDLAYPIIRCYRTESALTEAVSGWAPLQVDSPIPPDPPYIELFDYSYFSGASIYISGDYTNLDIIGWNDRVGSYIAENKCQALSTSMPGTRAAPYSLAAIRS